MDIVVLSHKSELCVSVEMLTFRRSVRSVLFHIMSITAYRIDLTLINLDFNIYFFISDQCVKTCSIKKLKEKIYLRVEDKFITVSQPKGKC